MTDISKHPLLKQAHEVYQAIESCWTKLDLEDAENKATALIIDLGAHLRQEETSCDFSSALRWLKDGKRIQRAEWNGKGWLEYKTSLFTADLPYIQMIYPVPGDGSLPYPNGARVPWTPSQIDIMANDWRVFS